MESRGWGLQSSFVDKERGFHLMKREVGIAAWVNVMFQPKVWCDENVMKVWVEHEWGNMLTNTPKANSSKILVADIHRAQQTDEVKLLLQRKKTLLINVPPGCTSRVQALDVSVTKPFQRCGQDSVWETPLWQSHLYTGGKILASERRVLLTR